MVIMFVKHIFTKLELITCASSEARHKFRFATCFFFYLCRGLQPLDVILDILDSGYIRLFDIILDILNKRLLQESETSTNHAVPPIQLHLLISGSEIWWNTGE